MRRFIIRRYLRMSHAEILQERYRVCGALDAAISACQWGVWYDLPANKLDELGEQERSLFQQFSVIEQVIRLRHGGLYG